MNEQIKEIADRLRGLRDVLELSTKDVAQTCNISQTEYEKYESGEHDIPYRFLEQMALYYGVPVYTLLGGEEPHVSSYFVTRKECGISIEHSKVYTHQYLAGGLKGARTTPYIVTVKACDEPAPLNLHTGQEFNLVLQGTLLLIIDERKIILKKGDSICFHAKHQHSIQAIKKKSIFLTILL